MQAGTVALAQGSRLRPFVSREELLHDLVRKQPLEPGMQLKCSSHGDASWACCCRR